MTIKIRHLNSKLNLKNLLILQKTILKYLYSYSIQKRQPLSLAILGPFLVIFCQLHNNLSQELSADSHFEVQNMSKFDWIKSYTIKQKLFCFHLFQFWQKKVWKSMTHKWPFFDHFWSLICQLHDNLSQNLGPDGA